MRWRRPAPCCSRPRAEREGIDGLVCCRGGSRDARGHHGNARQRADCLFCADGALRRMGPRRHRQHQFIRIDWTCVWQRRHGVCRRSTEHPRRLLACRLNDGRLPDRRVTGGIALDAVRAFLSCRRAGRRHAVRANFRLCRELVSESGRRGDRCGSCWPGGRSRQRSLAGGVSHRVFRMAQRNACARLRDLGDPFAAGLRHATGSRRRRRIVSRA